MSSRRDPICHLIESLLSSSLIKESILVNLTYSLYFCIHTKDGLCSDWSTTHHLPFGHEMRKLANQTVLTARNQLQDGKSAREVSSNVGVSINSALRIRNADKENIPPSTMGRPGKILKATSRVLSRQFNTGQLQTLQDGQRLVQSVDGEQVHPRTVQRNLEKDGLKAYVKQRKPDLTPNHRRERYEFAKAHLHWTLDDWKCEMFSDETSISRVGSFGRQFYYSNQEHRRFKVHRIKKTKQSGGGKIMVWGCMTYHGVGDAA